MDKQTFEQNTDGQHKKEDIEWLRVWCEETDSDLPRVAMIGDSITEQVYETVKKELQGVAKIDYLATSYSILSPAYVKMVKAFVDDSRYALIYFNYGLHAGGLPIDGYESGCRNILAELLKRARVIIGSTTAVHGQYEKSMAMVEQRNACITRLASELGLTVDDGFCISAELGAEGKTDGVHFNETGVERLAKHKAEWIKKLLNQ